MLATAIAGTMGLLLSQEQFRAVLREAAFSADWWLSRATVVALCFAFLMAFLVIAPCSAKSKDQPVDFERVAEFPDAGAFLADLKRWGPDALTECRLTNCYYIARVCVQKYTCLRSALSFAALGALLTTICFIKFGS